MTGVTDTSLQLAQGEKRPRLAGFFRRLVREKPLGTLGAIVVLILLFSGIFANFLAPYRMDEIHLDARLAPPSRQYLLGTDQLGRDVLSRIIYGARVSVIIGLSAATLNIVVASLVGIPSGFFGGKFDLLMQRFVDAVMAFPGLLILITVMSIVGQGMVQIILVLGIFAGIPGSRVIRSAVIGIKENLYFTAAQVIGSPSTRTLSRHVVPNIMPPIIIVFTTSIGGIILAEASLSFLGFGLPPDVPSWGGMLSGEGRRFMEMAPRLALWPGLCLSVVVYGLNMFGDALRDLLDPRLRSGAGSIGGRGLKSARRALKKRQARADKS